MEQGLLQLFPVERRSFWKQTARVQEKVEEIRLRTGQPVLVKRQGQEWYLDDNGTFTDRPERAYRVKAGELEELLQHICHYSLYAFADEVRQGFLTVAGGHRVGIAGQVVLDGDGSVRTIKNVHYMNIRVAHQVKGAADRILPYLYKGEDLKNTLIISPPGCGKTTLLRDLVRQISEGSGGHAGKCVGLVDERSEIAGSYLGQPQNDVGSRTDVLDACPKALGMMMLLRSMAPEVVAVDELGGEDDMKALRMAASCGCRILATIHGEDIRDVSEKLQSGNLLLEGLFELFLVLSREGGKPVVKQIYGKEEAYAQMAGRDHDPVGKSGAGTLVSGTVSGQTKAASEIVRHPGDAHQ